jgi:hypothetical protein
MKVKSGAATLKHFYLIVFELAWLS